MPYDANYAQPDGRQSLSTPLRFGGQTDRRRGMLVALVQSVVSAFDEYFSPLDEAGRQETSHHANDDFLNKRGVHWHLYRAEAVPLPGATLVPQRNFS